MEKPLLEVRKGDGSVAVHTRSLADKIIDKLFEQTGEPPKKRGEMVHVARAPPLEVFIGDLETVDESEEQGQRPAAEEADAEGESFDELDGFQKKPEEQESE